MNQKSAAEWFDASDVRVRLFGRADVSAMRRIWNQVVEDGRAFPQEDLLATDDEAYEFFASQTATAVAAVPSNQRACAAGGAGEVLQAGGDATSETEGDRPEAVLGLYILHPNNVGRCGHIANTSYAVAREARGMHLGEALVRDSLVRARDKGFRVLQFNAVVASNASALHLYEKIGFTRLGAIPGGFRNIDGVYEDIYPHYYDLTTL